MSIFLGVFCNKKNVLYIYNIMLNFGAATETIRFPAGPVFLFPITQPCHLLTALSLSLTIFYFKLSAPFPTNFDF